MESNSKLTTSQKLISRLKANFVKNAKNCRDSVLKVRAPFQF